MPAQGFGQFIGGQGAPAQPSQPAQSGLGKQIGGGAAGPEAMQAALAQQQQLLQLGKRLEVLKKGGPEADALIQQLVAQGKAPPDLDGLLALLENTPLEVLQRGPEGQAPGPEQQTFQKDLGKAT